MGFRDGAFCKLWKLDTTGKYPQGQISISRKDKDSGEYVDDFSGYVSFIGDAATAIKKIPAQGRFKIKGCDVSRVWNKEKQREFINFRVFDLEDATSAAPSTAPANQQKPRGTTKKQSDDMSVAELEARLAEAKLRESGRSVAENPDDLPF
jgi:hypothetical protein